MKKAILVVLASGLCATAASAMDDPIFHSTDALAARDEWGTLHQSPALNPTDFAPRYHWRPLYYLESGRDLAAQPAYVGALQVALVRLGYYCGPIDGIFSPEVADAIARLQKNYSMRVTGRLSVPVRRALFLP
jgi:Putative peptidoglycan binding domain